jgi:hypothetical protein
MNKSVFALEVQGLAAVPLVEPGPVAKLHRDPVPRQALDAAGDQVQARRSVHEPGGELEEHHPELACRSQRIKAERKRSHSASRISGGTSL